MEITPLDTGCWLPFRALVLATTPTLHLAHGGIRHYSAGSHLSGADPS